jgi:hypothetical protein
MTFCILSTGTPSPNITFNRIWRIAGHGAKLGRPAEEVS